ncbi:TonB-dependent receptor [Formosa agariphila KMM 3901]|uniref:TonB-dependent receptor n=1 Tax=Formosa agariphila (strain DSM 15362 / KCTC 12365 / LMG 23005 / KMM 3901 / M-2Alg 35-1) TaxID=1347342 RepID=T2KQP2_FORAG|nr:TonB-dependent receptor [Formosa agariphila]CDF81060.1 TonB-dependent receptor [Formosa agariphila KMM 3901]
MNLIKQVVFSLLFLSICFNIQAQSGKDVKITGVVIDQETKQPLEYATVAFRNSKDNSVVTGGITDMNGKFNIPVPVGVYNVSFEYISFKKQTILSKNLSKNTDLGTIILALDTESLDEVEIIAEKTTVDIRLDKKIYNVGQDLTVSGGTVSDVLDNVPSVSVDVEGNVALRGNDNVTILINGKPSGLVGLNSTDALNQLPSDAIERVEVITSPSARYDAEGTGGILNIILRRSKLQGFNGSITANAGYPDMAGISGNVNYRTGDFNFFNTTGYSYRESPGNSATETDYFNYEFDDEGNIINDLPDTYLNEYRDFDRVTKGLNTNLGVEWYITDNTSLTGAVFYKNNDNSSNTTNNIFEVDNLGNTINETLRFDPESEDDKTIQYSLNFDKQFDAPGHKLTFDFQYEDTTEDENSLITENGLDTEKVRTLENQEEVLLQADYVLPIGEDGQFEFGYRGNFNTLDTDYTLAFNDGSDFVVDTDVSNNLIYEERINALYTQYGNKIKDKFSYLLGLRMESTGITIDQVTSNDYEKKDYLGFFPTVNLGYEISEDQSVMFGYNRRIRRPRSRYINPFPSRSSATNLFQGNPDLDPSYSSSVDLGYLNQLGKLTLNSSVYYQHSTDVFTFISEATGETVLVGGTEIPVIKRSPINLATNDRYGFEFTTTYRASKKWNMNANFNFFNSITRGDYNGINFDADNLSWFIRLNNKVTLPAEIEWQTRLMYRGPSEDAQNETDGMFYCGLAFSKEVFNKNASITLNINDVFNSMKRSTLSTTETYISDSEYQRRERSFNIAFTYRFNQQKSRQERGERNGDGDDMDFEG